MTVFDAFERGLAVLAADRSQTSSLSKYAAAWVNLALAEMFGAENSIRAFEGRPELSDIPTLAGGGDVIPYSDSLVSGALPYFIASLAAKDDEDLFFSQFCRARFCEEVSRASKAVCGGVADFYSDINEREA